MPIVILHVLNKVEKNPKSVLSFLGYNEEHTVDGGQCLGYDTHPLWCWPYPSNLDFWYNSGS